MTLSAIIIPVSGTYAQESNLILAELGVAKYKIVKPRAASPAEGKAALVLQAYLKEISGADFLITTDDKPKETGEILIGNTNRNIEPPSGLVEDGFIIASGPAALQISGIGKGTLYGIYAFLEKYLGCKKYAAAFKVIPKKPTIVLAGPAMKENPAFNFRGLYFKDPETDQEFLDWHRLHRIEDKWGLWGHSFHKLVSPAAYFKEHPEYFSLVNGQRNTAQLCLTNKNVLQIVIAALQERMGEDPDAKYWSVSQNDGPGYCTCENCSRLNEINEGPQGSLLSFVNEVAVNFPDKIISTLAYTWSRKPPVQVRPVSNVNILLSDIEINRNASVKTDPRSESFRTDLHNWGRISSNIILWDYVTQFTNYTSPFPNLPYLKANMAYFATNVKGIFIQGPVETAGEFSELRAYLLAKLTWNPDVDEKLLVEEYLTAYYGKASNSIREYLRALEGNAAKFNSRVDIYDNPIVPYRSHLNPELLASYSRILKAGLQMVKPGAEQFQHVKSARLPIMFAQLQQARYFGTEANGVFEHQNGKWMVRKRVKTLLNDFLITARESHVTQLNESGLTLEAYEKEWLSLLQKGPEIHKAFRKPVTLLTPTAGDFTGKGARTLTDGNAGTLDFQYNWLGWYGNDMEVIIDLAALTSIQQVKLSFLRNLQHQMYHPSEIILEASADGNVYKALKKELYPAAEEESPSQVRVFSLDFNRQEARFIKIKARNLAAVPSWVLDRKKLPWILCDEIIVN